MTPACDQTSTLAVEAWRRPPPEMFRRLIMAMIGVGVWTRKHATVALDAALHPGLFTHLVTSVAAAEVLESGRS